MLYNIQMFTTALKSSTSAETSWWIISAFLLNSGSRKTPIKDCEPNSHRQLLQIQFNTSGICFDSVLPTNMLSPKWTDIYTVYFQITTNKDQVVGGVSRWRTVCLKACSELNVDSSLYLDSYKNTYIFLYNLHWQIMKGLRVDDNVVWQGATANVKKRLN